MYKQVGGVFGFVAIGIAIAVGGGTLNSALGAAAGLAFFGIIYAILYVGDGIIEAIKKPSADEPKPDKA